MAYSASRMARPWSIVVEDDGSLFREVLQDLERAGRRLHPGWDGFGPGRTMGSDGMVCFGPVEADEDAQAALLAALGGADLVVSVSAAADFATFIDDLGRVGAVEVRSGPPPDNTLNGDERSLLVLLAEGATVAKAAQELHLSLRTAHRRLTRARAALGARSTAEAVHVARTRGLC